MSDLGMDMLVELMGCVAVHAIWFLCGAIIILTFYGWCS